MGEIGSGLTALLVDDEDVIHELMSALLGDLEFEMSSARTLGEGRELLSSRRFDLVILDKNLPDGSGLEVARELEDADSAVIMISGYANVSSAVEAIRAGVADYIVKPFDIGDIEARVTRVVEGLVLRRSNTALLAELEDKNAQLQRIAATDPLTGLANFGYFRELARNEISRCQRHADQCSVAHLDIDGFARLNETLGHAGADELLQRIGTGLSGKLSSVSPLRSHDVVARVGADRFALLLPSTDLAAAAARVRKLQTELTSAVSNDTTVVLSAAVASFPSDGEDLPDLLAALALALKASKQAGSGTLTAYSKELSEAEAANRQAAERSASQQRALEEAIKNPPFKMFYQPIVDTDRTIFAYEALLRGYSSEFRHPGEVFWTAERAGLVHELERVVRRVSVEPMSRLPEPRMMFMNMHPLTLFDPELLAGAETWLVESADRIVLEVTEVAAIGDFGRARESLAVLKRLGFKIAVDDLGAGYSGLNNLALLDPDFVKLDMSLVRDIDKNPRLGSLIRHILDFAKSEGMKVIAEGVETEEEHDSVCDLGVQLIQGYYFAKPSPPFLELPG